MFTIPATELGTNSTVCVETSVTSNGRSMAIRNAVGGPTFIQIPHPITTVAQLKLWVGGVNALDLDTIHLPHAEYTAIAADWMTYHNPQPTSAFKVGDWVTWSPRNTSMNFGALIPGQTYCIIACAWSGPPACWSLSLSAGGGIVDVADEDELTYVIQPPAQTCAQLSLFGQDPDDVGYVLGSPKFTPVKKCECGATKCKSHIHSEWCPMSAPRN